HLYADAIGVDDLFIPGGGSCRPASAETVAENLHTVKMNGKAVFAHAVHSLAASARVALAANGMQAADLDLVVAHQANLRIVEGVAKRCGVPMDRFFLNIQRYGNTSSASVPIA